MKASVKLFGKLLDFAVENPEVSPDKLIIMDLKKETFNKLFTPSRIDIIYAIKEIKPETVNELAKYLKRPLESVSRDLRILESYGILEFVRSGKTKKPKIEKEMILIPLAY